MSGMLLGLFPELSQVGGIQLVSRHVGATLQEFAERRGELCELVGLNDPAGKGTFQVGGREYPFRGFARSKAGLLTHLIARARLTDLVFVGHVNLGPATLLMSVFQHRVCYWITVHGMEVWKPLPLLRRTALRRATGIIAVSRHTAEAAERVQGVKRDRIMVLNPALDPCYSSLEPLPARLPVPAGSRSLLTVARLSACEPGKGVDTVIRALPRLLISFPSLYYVIVGGGDAKPSLVKLAAECGVAERVIFMGTSNAQSLREYYEEADVFVMPSRQEGFGIVYLEAMAAGKPVVAAGCGGAPEVVSDGETGFLVKYGDVRELEMRLLSLLADDRLRQRMGEAGRRKTAERYQYEQFRERLMAILGAKSE